MSLDPQTQGDARIRKHADVCNGYIPTSWRTKRNAKWVVPNAATAGVTLRSAIQTEPLGKTLTHCEPKYADCHGRAV